MRGKLALKQTMRVGRHSHTMGIIRNVNSELRVGCGRGKKKTDRSKGKVKRMQAQPKQGERWLARFMGQGLFRCASIPNFQHPGHEEKAGKRRG